MSSSLGPFSFHVPFETKTRVKKWWKASLFSEVIFPPIEAELAKATHVVWDDDDPMPITSVRDLKTASKKWRDKRYVAIYAGANRKTATWLLHVRFDTAGPSIGIEVATDPKGKVREQFDTCLAAWSAGLAAHTLYLSIGYMVPAVAEYPRPRPPREGLGWPLGKLDMYLGKHWHVEDDREDVLARIEKARLTAGVRRVRVGDDVLRIAFDGDLDDDASVKRALALGEKWLTPLVPTEVAPGWNDKGDEMIIPGAPVERDPFTFFDTDEDVGYWALIRDPEDGSVDEERWKKLSAIAKKGKLADKTKVRAIRLIAPVRKEAVALLEKATAAGFEMVTYPGDNGVFWRVYPEAAGTRRDKTTSRSSSSRTRP